MSTDGDNGVLWGYVNGLREDLGRAEERIHEMHEEFIQAVHRIGRLEDRCASLEKQTPSALQAERELAETLADNAGRDYHGRDCNCSYCATDKDES
jgi:phage shock protein A